MFFNINLIAIHQIVIISSNNTNYNLFELENSHNAKIIAKSKKRA
jgi:hypothetical protein